MVTVQHIVKKELEKNPFLIDILQQGLANVSAVADKMHAAIEKEIRKKVKISAISMSIRRYITETSGKEMFKWPFPENLEVSTKSKIYEVAIERNPQFREIAKNIGKAIDKSKGDFLSIIEGTYEIVIFTNQKNKELIKRLLSSQRINSELNNLTYITIDWPKITKDIPGIYYRITRALAFKGISIQAFDTIGTEMMLFFKEPVFVEAYETIMRILQKKGEL